MGFRGLGFVVLLKGVGFGWASKSGLLRGSRDLVSGL